MIEGELARQAGEGVTAFSVRLIQHAAWVEGHDAGCGVSLHPCAYHRSPFSDEAEREFRQASPPGSTSAEGAPRG